MAQATDREVAAKTSRPSSSFHDGHLLRDPEMISDQAKILLLAGAGAALAGGLFYAFTKKPSASAPPTPPSLPITPVSFGPENPGPVAGQVVQSRGYVFTFNSTPYAALGQDWRASIENALIYLGWSVHVQASGLPSIANDLLDNGIPNGQAGYTAIATWTLSSGNLYDSKDSTPISYTKLVPINA